MDQQIKMEQKTSQHILKQFTSIFKRKAMDTKKMQIK